MNPTHTQPTNCRATILHKETGYTITQTLDLRGFREPDTLIKYILMERDALMGDFEPEYDYEYEHMGGSIDKWNLLKIEF